MEVWIYYVIGAVLLLAILGIVYLYVKEKSSMTCPRCFGTGEKTVVDDNTVECDWCEGSGSVTRWQLRKIQRVENKAKPKETSA